MRKLIRNRGVYEEGEKVEEDERKKRGGQQGGRKEENLQELEKEGMEGSDYVGKKQKKKKKIEESFAMLIVVGRGTKGVVTLCHQLFGSLCNNVATCI